MAVQSPPQSPPQSPAISPGLQHLYDGDARAALQGHAAPPLPRTVHLRHHRHQRRSTRHPGHARLVGAARVPLRRGGPAAGVGERVPAPSRRRGAQGGAHRARLPPDHLRPQGVHRHPHRVGRGHAVLQAGARVLGDAARVRQGHLRRLLPHGRRPAALRGGRGDGALPAAGDGRHSGDVGRAGHRRRVAAACVGVVCSGGKVHDGDRRDHALHRRRDHGPRAGGQGAGVRPGRLLRLLFLGRLAAPPVGGRDWGGRPRRAKGGCDRAGADHGAHFDADAGPGGGGRGRAGLVQDLLGGGRRAARAARRGLRAVPGQAARLLGKVPGGE
mmetsp:Transcript_15940/g.47774  ORF Transcript_15940/g.47774 Transcript_15940/m.47774 type:complete len:329 (-) Transcript_15940:152-1138(-)